MTKFRVESYYGQDAHASAEFLTEEQALSYADEQRKAMPRWYKKVRIVRVTEEVTNIWHHVD